MRSAQALRSLRKSTNAKRPKRGACILLVAGAGLGVSSLIRFAHKWLLPGLARREATSLRLASPHASKAVCSLPVRNEKRPPHGRPYLILLRGEAWSQIFPRRRSEILRPRLAVSPTGSASLRPASPDAKYSSTSLPPQKHKCKTPQGGACILLVAGAGLAPATSRL